MMLEQQQQATGARVNGLMKELQSRSKKVKELEIQLEETSEAYASETHWQSTLTDKLEKVQRDHDKKHEELVNLQNEHSDHKQTHEERHNELSQKLAEHEVKLTNTHSEKEEVKAQLNDALTEISNKELQLHQSKQEGVELSSKLENLQTELEREKKNVQDLITERKAMEAKLTQEVESCKTTAEDMRLAQQTELKGLNDAINTAKQDFGAVNAEKGELKKQVREYQRRSQQQEKSMNDLRTQGQKKVAQLQSQLEKHKLDHTKIRNELQQKTSKELQLEMQLDHEKEMRETAIADKDTQIFSFQKDITEKSKTMKKKEVKIQQLTTLIEEKDNELVALQAAKSVFTMEKEKQQVLWETSMSEHFNKIHENEHKYNELEMQFEEFKESQEVEKAEIQRELLEYKTIVQQVQTTKQGLLRKQTRTRRMFQTWSVKHFTLVGGALLYKDPNSAAANAEKAFQMNSTTTITGSTTVKYGFSIQTLDNELVLQAIDQDDMNSWMLELKESVSAMSAKAYIDPAQVAAFGKLENGDEQDINEES
uniref:PH domain-containing protein n=2 Tax=Octactis speculum TaxID=3111310 RepID=A0A7S2F6U8_9STRA|mmetsp:Transcript_14402/g.19194  ORF Transcript_14402/g.19194 Transcript_14402/m.19194 type:complete len:539 (+) Transcript_14402:140-1756(+)